MRIAVMGSGGLGGYFGALLARGGSEVSFIARGAHLEAMREAGLRVEGGPDPFYLEHVRVTDDPSDIGPVDLVIGSGLEFEERGSYELKGVPGEWHLFAVASARTT